MIGPTINNCARRTVESLRKWKISFILHREINHILRLNRNKYSFRLDLDLEREIRRLWSGYNKKIHTKWHIFYISINGIKDHRYIPEDIFYNEIESKLNNMDLQAGYDDKNMYSRLFPRVKMPETLIRNIHGRYLDDVYNALDKTNAIKRLNMSRGFYFIKPAIGTCGGTNVSKILLEDGKIYLDEHLVSFHELETRYKQDFIIQKAIQQSKKTGCVYPLSLNTIRIITLRLNNQIEYLSAYFRMGNNGACIDNVCYQGIACGINPDGRLTDTGTDRYYNTIENHPVTNMTFNKICLPLDNLEAFVKQLHEKLLHFDLISWDVALDEDNTPLLIEMNLKGQGLNYHQIFNGPLFGPYTEEVLKRCFG